MYKATTPVFHLEIPYTANEINNFILTLEQQKINVLSLTQENCTVADNLISFTLTQEASNLFVHRYPIHLQMRIMLNSGKVVASDVEHIYVHRVLDDTVLELIDSPSSTDASITDVETDNNISLSFNDNITNLKLEFE